ncbi:MAG TPA: alkaline phosphatase PhoX, partial [Kofleriaceae bacterium]|nr:alkaline phosphatase PhoX [Kofleriaceae bacterium]
MTWMVVHQFTGCTDGVGAGATATHTLCETARPMSSGPFALIAVALLAPACFHPHYDRPACGPNGECPSGLTCGSTGFCEAGGTDPGGNTLPLDLELLAGDIGGRGNADGSRSTARFSSPTGVAIDSAGNVYVADQANQTIRMVTAAGVVMTLAGNAGMSGSADGTGTAARFGNPTGVAVDNDGNVYVADQSNYTIRKVTATGIVTTLAGTAGMSGSADGTGTA